MDATITEPLELAQMAQSMGFGGIGLLATVFAFKLAMQSVEVVRGMVGQRRQNGNGGGNGYFEKLAKELSLRCPVATGRRTVDDLYDVLVRLDTTMVGVKDGQVTMASDMKDGNEKVVAALGTLTVDLAKGGRIR